MSLLSRRIIFYLTLCLFLIAAPAIILHTAGFRYNFKQKKLLKTGALVIASDPKEAEIWINGRLRTERTPAKILNLTPGDYAVRVSRSDFYPWQKTLSVESAQVTLAENITLFRQETPNILLAGKPVDLIPEPAGDRFLVLQENGGFYEIWMRKENDSSLIWRSAFEAAPAFVEWAPKRNEVLMSARGFFLLDLDAPTPELKPVLPPAGKPWNRLVYGKNQTLLFGTAGATLYSVNPNTLAADVLEQNVSDFGFLGNDLVILASADDGTTSVKLLRGATASTIAALDRGSWRAGANRDPWIILSDSKRGKTTIMNVKNGEVTEIEGNDALWISGENPSLVSFTDFEIWRSRPGTKETELLTRLSEPIREIFVGGLNNALVVATDTRITALEFDTRGRQNAYELASFDAIQDVLPDRRDKTLFIAAKKNNASGVWRLVIR